MHEKLNRNKDYTTWMIKRRSATAEPVLGTLISHHNIKRLNSRGKAQAKKHYYAISQKLPDIYPLNAKNYSGNYEKT